MAERIYITEDDDSIRELVTVALSAYSYEVESFVSAEDCLAATEKQVPDTSPTYPVPTIAIFISPCFLSSLSVQSP